MVGQATGRWNAVMDRLGYHLYSDILHLPLHSIVSCPTHIVGHSNFAYWTDTTVVQYDTWYFLAKTDFRTILVN